MAMQMMPSGFINIRPIKLAKLIETKRVKMFKVWHEFRNGQSYTYGRFR